MLDARGLEESDPCILFRDNTSYRGSRMAKLVPKKVAKRCQRDIWLLVLTAAQSTNPNLDPPCEYRNNLNVHCWMNGWRKCGVYILYRYIYSKNMYIICTVKIKYICKCMWICWMLFSLRKGNPATCYNMGEIWEHYAKWNKSQKDKCCIILLLWSIQHKLIGTESRMVVSCQGLLGCGNRELLLMDIEF